MKSKTMFTSNSNNRLAPDTLYYDRNSEGSGYFSNIQSPHTDRSHRNSKTFILIFVAFTSPTLNSGRKSNSRSRLLMGNSILIF